MNLSLTQFPATKSEWTRLVEQKIVELEAKVWRLQNDLAQLRNQVGNYPVDPNVVLP